MSTRSDISVLLPDGTVQTQYIHMDGYLSHNGQLLLDNYKTLEDAKKIQELGKYRMDSTLPSSPEKLEETIKGKEVFKKDFKQEYGSVREQLLSFSKATTYKTDTGEVEHLDSDVEYHYLYAPDKQGQYQWHTINRDGIVPLTQKIIDSEVEGKSNYPINWSKSPSGEFSPALTFKENQNLFKSGDQLQKNLETYELKQAEKVFSSNRVSASWYLQRNRVEDEALDNAFADWGSKNHTEAEKLKEMESNLSTKQVDYFNKLYDSTRDKTLAASNVSRLSKDAEQKIESMVPKEEAKQTNDIFDEIAKINKQTAEKDKKVEKKSTAKQKFNRDVWKKQHDKTVDYLKKGLLKEVENYTATPEQTLEFLKFSDKFHQYSARNTMLIHMQRSGAVALGSYAKFKSMGYNVQKGEKGIKMFVPAKTTSFYRKDKDGNNVSTQLRYATNAEKEKIKAGQIETYSKTVYKIGTVFDATQTDMPKEKYPELYPNRHIDFKNKNPEQLETLDKGLRQVAEDMNMPVITYDHSMKDIKDPQNAKGYFNASTNQIVLNQYNTPTENITVLAHELGHAQLHNDTKQEKNLPRELKEMQAELTSYMYASHYGIDTKEETVRYISEWTQNGKKFNELPTGVKGQVLTHASSAAKVLTKFTDKVIEQEQDRIDQIAEKEFMKSPETSQWYNQREAMENEITDRENGLKVGHSELDKLHEIESKMTPHEVANLDSKFSETHSFSSDRVTSLVSKQVKDKITENAAKVNNQVEQSKENDQKAQYQQYLAQQGMQR